MTVPCQRSLMMLLALCFGGLGCGGMVCPVALAATPNAERVELFAAIKDGQVDVKFIPKDSRQATVVIRSKSDRPLSIALPDAFAATPIVAQVGGNQNIGGGGGNAGGGNQAMGGGMMGGGMMGGMGGGFFDVAPGKVGKIKLGTVCLEHGKEDPNPRIPYELKPIAEFTGNAAVHEVCRMLAQGELDQASAQAAAWHLTDNLSWQELAQKVGVKHLNGQVEMYFSPQQLQTAMRAVAVAVSRANVDSPEATSPGESLQAVSSN